MKYMGTGCLSGRLGSGPSKFSTHIGCFIDGHSLLSGLKHNKPTTIKHPISCSSKSPFNLSATTSNSFPPPYLAPNHSTNLCLPGSAFVKDTRKKTINLN
ncbi:hypothetical protein Hanom_Chr14g01291181 [Helianthus anomalus]